MARKELVVEARQVTGKKVAALRRAGILPGNIFGKGIESESIQLETELLASTLKAAVANEVIDLKVGSGTARPVVIHKISRNPLNGKTDDTVEVVVVELRRRLAREGLDHGPASIADRLRLDWLLVFRSGSSEIICYEVNSILCDK